MRAINNTVIRISSFLNSNKEISVILVLGLIFRLVYFWIIIHNFGNGGFYLSSNGDAVEYFELAKQILFKGTFNDIYTGAPEIFRMPGYPLFIAFFYRIISDISLAIFWQNIIFICFIALFYKFVLDVFKNKFIALVSASFLSFEPSMIYWNNQLITESLFVVSIFASFYCAYIFSKIKKIYYLFFSGFILAVAIFIRPAGEYLALFFVIFLFILVLEKKIGWKKMFLGILIFLATFMACLYPWFYRNNKYFGSYALSNSSNIAFGKYVSAIAKQIGEGENILINSNPFYVAENAKKRAIELISQYPYVFIKLYFVSLVPFFVSDSYLSFVGRIFPDVENQRVVMDWKGDNNNLFIFLRGHEGVEVFIFFGGKIVWGVITLLALFGLWYWLVKYKKKYATLIFILLIIIYFSLASGIGSYSRFRFPINPYIFLLASAGIYFLKNCKDKDILSRLMIITQRVDKRDFNLGFFHKWLEEMAGYFDSIEVITLGTGEYTLPKNVRVHSLGKEKGARKFIKIINFYKLIFKLKNNYNTVFVHMNPEYVVLGGLWWRLWNKPVYLWYLHKSVTWKLKFAEKFVKKIFTANKESCRLKNRTKIAEVGHGVDSGLFKKKEINKNDKFTILSVGRMSRVKKYEIILEAIKLIPNLVYFILIGAIIDNEGEKYMEEFKDLIVKNNIDGEVINGVDHQRLVDFYNKADLFIHTSETGSVDKVVLEAMACETPVLTSSEAFSFLSDKYRFKKGDIDELVKKITEFSIVRERAPELRKIIEDRFSLIKLIHRLKKEIYD